MKTLLSFFTLFSLIVFLLPLAALNPDKTENRSDTTVDKIVSSAVSQPIRQEEVLPIPAQQHITVNPKHTGRSAGTAAGIFFYFRPQYRSSRKSCCSGLFVRCCGCGTPPRVSPGSDEGTSCGISYLCAILSGTSFARSRRR